MRKAVILSIEVGEVPAVLAPRYAGLAGIARPAFESAQPFIDISREARLAELSVADNVDADFGLPAHHLGYALAQTLGKAFPIVGLFVYPGAHGIDNLHRAGQAADVGRKNSFRAALHSDLFASVSFIGISHNLINLVGARESFYGFQPACVSSPSAFFAKLKS